MKTIIEDNILEALRACYDLGYTHNLTAGRTPGKPVNIVDLGCVDSIALTHDNNAPGAGIPGVPPRLRLNLQLIPASSDKDSRAQLEAQVLNCLAGIEQLTHVHLSFNESEVWTPARISPEARRRLKLDPAPFAILNNRR